MFKIKDLLKATNGELLQGRANTSVKDISSDTRTIKLGELFIALEGNNFDGHHFIKDAIKNKVRAIIISKRINYPKNLVVILVPDTRRALEDIASFHRNKFKIPIIAITGSNGKTTTKDMLAHILSKKYRVLFTEGTENNSIGVSKALLKLNKNHQIAVLELATNHFGEILNLARISRPDTAIFTNIGQSHLEFLKNLPAVFREKYSLIKHLKSKGRIIFNNDDRHLRKIEKKSKRRFKICAFSIKSDSDFKATKINLGFDYLDFLFNNKIWIRLRTPAEYNVYNALAAIACAKSFRLNIKTIKSALEEFQLPKRRFNFNRIKDFYLIDDCYNSNPSSLTNAIAVLSRYRCGKRILVCGDMLELGKTSKQLHFGLGKKIGRNGIDFLIAVGKLAGWTARGAQKGKLNKRRIWRFNSSDKVANRLAKIIDTGDVILVKGSRLVAMEKVVEDIKKRFNS
ncbi:MAG: UDP-N-acetylmuramoyl-tripeptide--D-alanyl-D-alanine ligase [Candidatus Omnitrophota bacterium]